MKRKYPNLDQAADPEFEEFKKRLGDTAKQYTQAQLRQLQRDIHVMAELLLDFYLLKQSGEIKDHDVLTGLGKTVTVTDTVPDFP